MIVDPRFTYEIDYGQSALPGLSILMNAVHAMADVALEDFEEPIVPISYSLGSFPEVIITPETTAPGGAIQTRFIVWGLWMGIVSIAGRHNPCAAKVTLKWEKAVVGYISVAKPKKPRTQLVGIGTNDTETFLRKSGISGLKGSELITPFPSNITQALGDSSFSVSFVPAGPSLTGFEVLITVLYALAYAAQYSSTKAAEAFELRPPVANNMYLAMVGAEATPFLQYRWVIEAIDKIPQYMLHQNRFSGASFKMLVGRTEIGQGQMLKE